MNYREASALAEQIKAKIEPLSHRCEIAGSVRRKKPDFIKDVELCILVNPVHMFALRDLVNHEWGPPAIGAYPSKYTRIRSSVNIDFFFPSRLQEWGMNLFIRTGSEDYVKRALIHWKKITSGGYSKDCILHLKDGTVVPTPEEADVFRELKCKFIEPERRV